MAIVLNMFNNPDPALHVAGVPLQPRNAVSRLARTLAGKKDTGENRQLDGVPIERMRYWFEHERLPPGWEPYHTTTLLETISTINRLRSAMSAMKKEAEAEGQVAKGEAVVERTVEVQGVEVVEADKDGRVSTEEELSTDDENIEGSQTLSVPSLVKTVSSATSESFTEGLRTPEASEFIVPPFVGDAKVTGLPMAEDEARRMGKQAVEIKGRQEVVVVA